MTAVFVFAAVNFASTTTVAQSIRFTFGGANAGDEFGSVINEAGDINADGHSDVIVGAPFDLPGLGNPGSATIYSGADGSVIIGFIGTAANQAFGFGVGPAYDVNNDGAADVIVGLSANGSTGLGPGGGARVFSGLTGTVLHTFGGTTAGDGFGQSVHGLGDLNADGFDDVIVGTAFGVGGVGYARVFSGFDGSLLYQKNGTFVGHRFGLAYTAGDVNNDGVNDFMIGALGANANGANCGSVTVYSGATGGVLHTFNGVAAQDKLGYSGGAVGDINGDGFGDVIAGTFIPAGAGYARVYSGADGSILHHLTDGIFGDAFGHTVAGVGDVNGDGKPDFAVSAPNSNVNGALSGFVRVYSGFDGSILKQFDGAMAGIHYGYSINPAGDVNGDGLPDIAIGSLVGSALGIPGSASVVSVCAAQPYGAGLLPTQTLTMSWVHGAPGMASQGGPSISGAAAGALGLIGANAAPGNLTVLDVPVLFDVATPFILLEVVFDGTGSLSFPIDLRTPALAGYAFYMQAFESNAAAPQGVSASNGLMLLFGL